jgi:hypothetical protein
MLVKKEAYCPLLEVSVLTTWPNTFLLDYGLYQLLVTVLSPKLILPWHTSACLSYGCPACMLCAFFSFVFTLKLRTTQPHIQPNTQDGIMAQRSAPQWWYFGAAWQPSPPVLGPSLAFREQDERLCEHTWACFLPNPGWRGNMRNFHYGDQTYLANRYYTISLVDCKAILTGT